MTDTKTIAISGIPFTVPLRFSEGHVLNADEARVLNQTFHENLRNNNAKLVKDAIDAAGSADAVDVAALQEKLDAYAAAYDFSSVRVGGTMDPVERKAKEIAKAGVLAKLAAQGRKGEFVGKDASEENKRKLADKIAEIAVTEAVIKKARAAVKAEREAATALDDALGDL